MSIALNKKQHQHFPPLIWLILCIITTIAFSLLLGYVRGYDLQHYHYYNGFAFWTNRLLIDYRPAGLHSYFNPLLDTLNFLLIDHFTPAITITVIAFIQGITYYAAMSIGFLFFKRLGIKQPALWAFLFSINGLWAMTITRQLGAFNNDLVNSVFILLGLQLWFISLYQFKDYQHLSHFKIFIAGILFGIAVGLKLTMTIFAIALVLTVLSSPMVQQHFRCLFYLIMGCVIGFIITDGWWALFLYQHFHNPVFPFFNKVFHSSQWPNINSYDPHFKIKNKTLIPILPLLLNTSLINVTINFSIDYRYTLTYITLILLLCKQFYLRIKKPDSIHLKIDPVIFQFILFSIYSFIIWALIFFIYRYLCPLTLVTPILLLICLYYLIKPISNIIKIGLLLLIITTTHLPTYHIDLNKNAPMKIKLPNTITQHKHALVLMSNIFIWNHLIRSFPPQWRFINATKAIGAPYRGINFIINYPPKPAIMKHFIQWAHQNHAPIYLMISKKIIVKKILNQKWFNILKSYIHQNNLITTNFLNQYHFKKTGHCFNLLEKLRKQKNTYFYLSPNAITRIPLLCPIIQTKTTLVNRT